MMYIDYTGQTTIDLVTSSDGITWGSPTAVINKGAGGKFDSNILVGGTVIYESSNSGTTGPYQMWYTGHDGSTWRIGYAYSSDGINWTKQSGNLTGSACLAPGPNAWDNTHVANPGVVRYDPSDGNGVRYFMFFGGHNGSYYKIGVANSNNIDLGTSVNDWKEYRSR